MEKLTKDLMAKKEQKDIDNFAIKGEYMKDFTYAQKHDYIRKGGTVCPICRSDQLEGSCFDADAGTAYQRINCLECNLEFNDCYTLTDIELMD